MRLSLRFVITCCLLVTVLTGSGYLVLLQSDQPVNQHAGSIIIHRLKRSKPTTDAAVRRRRRRPSDRFKATTHRPPSPIIRALQFDKIDIFEHYEASVQSTTAVPLPSSETLTNEEEDRALYLTGLHFQDYHSEANQEAHSRSTVIPNIIPVEWQEEASDIKPFQPNDVIWAPHLTQPPPPVSTTPWPTAFDGEIQFKESEDLDHYTPKKTTGTIARKYKHRARYGGYGPPPYHHGGGGYHHQPVVVHPPPIIVNEKDKSVLKGFLFVFLIPLAIALALFVLFALAIGYAYTLAYVATILNSTNITYIYSLSGLTGLSGFSILPFITSLASGSFAYASTTQQQQQQQSSNNNNNNNNANNNNNNNVIVINATGRANKEDEMLVFKNPFKFAKFQDGEEGELMDN